MVDRKSPPQSEPPDLAAQARALLEDKELVRDFWDSGHEHLWTRTWAKIRDAIGGWFLRTSLAAAMAGLVVYGVKNGWWK